MILDPSYRIRGLRDSKLLDREQREALAPRIREHALAWAIAAVDVATIDQINIYWASKRAMEEAVGNLTLRPDHLLIDAMRISFDCAADAHHPRRRTLRLDRCGVHHREGRA